MGKKNVHKLSSEPGASLVLIGISSHENDYRLSWAINEHLDFHLAKRENLQSFNSRMNILQEFSVYSYTGDSLYSLISNRCENGFLLEELKNIDFLLLIEENETPFPIQEFMSKLKAIPFVSATFNIDLQTLKNKKRLL
jgi:hypothetical protein